MYAQHRVARTLPLCIRGVTVDDREWRCGEEGRRSKGGCCGAGSRSKGDEGLRSRMAATGRKTGLKVMKAGGRRVGADKQPGVVRRLTDVGARLKYDIRRARIFL